MHAFVIVLLQGYALALAWWHGLGGVHTDEAKYLLNIPYPHPPLLRWIMGQTTELPFQEMLWRIILATLVVQAVWFVWDMTRGLAKSSRLAVSVVWLLSPSVLLQGGTVMFGPVTAVMAIVLLWLLLKQRQGMAIAPEVWGLAWAVALLTAYQGATLLPLAAAGAWRADGSRLRRILAVLLPLLLVTIVTVTNPLAIATIVIHAEEGARLTFAEHTYGAALLWITAGAWIASIVGTLGLLARPRWEALGAFALTALFILGSAPFPFYGILFLPFLVEGVRSAFVASPKRFQAAPTTFVALFLVAGIWLKPWEDLRAEPSLARTVMQKIAFRAEEGRIAIEGSFGHQWSYESPLPVMRYVPEQIEGLSAVICLNECTPPRGWRKMEAPVDVWIP